MRKQDVTIGDEYVVKVSGKLVRVKITGESPYGGWDGRNLETGRDVRIRTAGRLRYAVAKQRRAGGSSHTDDASVTASETPIANN